MDFDTYKPRLKEYLQGHGIETGPGNIRCFNPEHDDSTASMNVKNESFRCYGCGAHGDVYDAAGLLHGITESGERYKAVESFFGGSFEPLPPRKNERRERPREPRFEPDDEALNTVVQYLREHVAEYQDDVRKFVEFRGYDDPTYGRYLAWWPGLDTVAESVSLDVLTAAGIPVPTDDGRGKAFKPAGVVCRLGRGLKLQYRKGSETAKRASYGAAVFPYPSLPDADTVVLVEGEFDALAGVYAGIDNVVGIGGTNGLTVEDAKTLHRYKEIVCLFDNDDAGHIACELKPPKHESAKPVTQIIRESGYTGTIRRALISSEKDLDDLVKYNKADEAFQAIADAEIVYGPEADDTGDNEATAAPEDFQETAIPPIDDAPPTTPAGENMPFQFIGYDDRSYYFLPKNQNIPISVGRGNNVLKNWIYEIAPPDWWYRNFTKENADGDPVFDIQSALTWIRSEEYKVGLYNDEHILGTGAHWDKLDGESRIMLNTGSGLMQHGGGVSDYHEYTGRNIYTKARISLDVDAEPWTVADGHRFMHELMTFNFEQSVQHFAVAGYAAIAPFAAALRRRPHIWITGRRGMGKSYLIEELMIPVLGEGYCFYSEGGTTEAAVRQTVGRDSRPVILDEFEATGKYDRGTLQNIISLARSAYGGAQKVKGSTSHKAISFATKMMFCFASINVNIENEADRSRIVICRMKQSGDEKMSPIHNPNGLRARMWSILPKIVKDIESAKLRIEEGGHDARTCDTYAPLLAGFWNVISDEPFYTGDERYAQMIDIAVREIGTVETQDDEQEILTHIFDYRITVEGKHDRTVWETLTESDDMGNLKYSADIQRYGIHRYTDAEGNHLLAVAAKNPYLSRMLEDTQFSNYKEVLSRNAAVVDKSRPVRVAGKQQRCIVFDWERVYAKYHGEESGEPVGVMPF